MLKNSPILLFPTDSTSYRLRELGTPASTGVHEDFDHLDQTSSERSVSTPDSGLMVSTSNKCACAEKSRDEGALQL